VCVCLPAVYTPGLRAESTSDEERIRSVLEQYVTGWRDGDVERLGRIFATDDGRILWRVIPPDRVHEHVRVDDDHGPTPATLSARSPPGAIPSPAHDPSRCRPAIYTRAIASEYGGPPGARQWWSASARLPIWRFQTREAAEKMDELSKQLAGQVVAHLDRLASGTVVIAFTSGSELVVKDSPQGPALALRRAGGRDRSGRSADAPTRRQREYLDFIRRYMARYGVSPAESDIADHFMVSGPSVNAMVRMLERRGFIARRRDFTGQAMPRSIRVLLDE
jgi:hypothetical protein